MAFRWLSANEAPDHRSISRFRRRHLAALEDLFVQVLRLGAKAGFVRLGRVALDGTKLDANASKHKAMSYDHIVAKIAELEAEVKALLEEAERVDQAFGEDRRGDERSAELARRESRLEKLRAAKEAIEAEAREKAEAAARKKAEVAGKGEEAAGAAAREAATRAEPKASAQRSFTDPEARMMKTNHGFAYAYNAERSSTRRARSSSPPR